MGAWSYESFGNDDACDWIAELEEHDDLGFVESTFDAVLAVGDDYLEAPEACAAIAAAEVVARLQGHFGRKDASSEGVDAWVERVRLQPPASLIDKACRALDRILSDPSELLELWEDAEPSGAWQAEVKNLKARVRLTS
jgi:hypothetical protein